MLPFILRVISFSLLVTGSYDHETYEENFCASFDNDRFVLKDEPYGIEIDPKWKAATPYQKFTQYVLTPLNEGRYSTRPKLLQVVKIAYEAISENQTERGANYAEAFAQYLKFVLPRGAIVCTDSAFTDAQAFFYFMVGDASTDEEKEYFANLVAVDIEFSRFLMKPMVRFDTLVLSLEAILWLRNFERVKPPADPKLPLADRMERIAWRSYNEPFASDMVYRVFEYKYNKAHGDLSSFRHVPNFIDLDYDFERAVVDMLQEEAANFVKDAHGKCEPFSPRLPGENTLHRIAVCSVQSEPGIKVDVGKIIAQEFKTYAEKNGFEVIKGDTRTDEEKFLVFTLDKTKVSAHEELLAVYLKKYVD